MEELLICPTCKNKSVEIIENCGNGMLIVACIYCDLPQDDHHDEPYINHCWNCGDDIDSRNSIASHISGMGYYCNYCGKDLSEWKAMMAAA